MKKIKKYSFGTNQGGIPHPNNAMIENQIMQVEAQADAASNPWINALSMLGQTGMQVGAQIGGPKAAALGSAVQMTDYLTMAFGGRVGVEPLTGGDKKKKGKKGNAEVEGDEVIETPDGMTTKVDGPSHEAGGVDVDLPPGTEVFSDRITVDGETIAKRKEGRINKLTKLEKKIEDNPQDSNLRKTYERMKENDEIIGNQEMQLQEMISTVMETNQPGEDPEMIEEFAYGGKKYAYGTGAMVDPGFLAMLAQAMNPNTSAFSQDNMFPNTFSNEIPSGVPQGKMAPMQKKGFSNMAQPKTAGDPVMGEMDFGGGEGGSFLEKMPDLGITGGDAVGMLGNLISTFGPMKNTKEARSKDRPNINYFENYGEDALDTVNEQKDYLDEMKSNAKMDLEVSKRTAMNRNRKSARGVNTMRALDLGTEMGAMGEERKINSDAAAKMLDILSSEAGLENQRDFRQMFGEQQKDIADRMDQDAYYSQLAQDIATKGQGIQKIGGDLNRIQEQKQMQNLLSQMTQYFDIDSTGKITKKGS